MRTSPELLFVTLAALGPAAPSGATQAAQDLDAALARGVEILLELQEDLGGAGPAREWPYEGVYRVEGEIPWGYRVGGTAICAGALMETAQFEREADVRAAVERGLGFVMQALDHELMAPAFEGSYDVRGWGHAYALGLLLRMRARGLVPEYRRFKVDQEIAWLVWTLQATEIAEGGGWNYSRRRGDASSPASHFMTAPTLLALYEAARQGEEVDPAVVERALDVLEESRSENGFFPYSTAGGRDSVAGSIGRTPVTEVALYLAGRSDTESLRRSLDGFFEHWSELEERRKQTGTHAGEHGIAPYYFYYAHRYAALAIDLLPEAQRAAYRAQLLARLFEVREESGGWNDRVFPRSESYGTAMTLLALLEPGLPDPPRWAGGARGPGKLRSKEAGGARETGDDRE